MSRVLLLSPDFHGYWESIERAFRAMGHECVTCRYDVWGSRQAKLVNKGLVELPKLFGIDRSRGPWPRHTANALAAFEGVRPDVVVVIRGDTLADEWWDRLDQSGVRKVVWLYDEVRRMAYQPELLQRIGRVASYSPGDVAMLSALGIRTAFVPNGFDETMVVRRTKPRDEVAFVGARYPNRDRAMRALHAGGVPVRAYGRDWSDHWYDRARTWRVRPSEVPAHRDLSRMGAYEVMAASAANLNMHDNQDGFTMRTFEIPGVGGVQLIDRKDVSDFYEPGREVAVFESDAELIELAKRARSDGPWAARMREAGQRRTLAEHTFTRRVREVEALWAD